MRLSTLKRQILLTLADGNALPGELWAYASHRLSRNIPNGAFHRALGELAAGGLLIYTPRPLSDRELKAMLKALSKPNQPLGPGRKSDYVRLTNDGHYIVDLLKLTHLLPAIYHERMQALIGQTIKRAEATPR